MRATRVVNQPLPSEEEMKEASQRSALVVLDPKETVQTESYEKPIRVALEEVEAKKLPKMAEEKNEEKRAEGDEEAQPRKEKKEKKSSEKKERRREGKRLKKKEEKRKRAESPEVDEESTTAKVDEGMSTQQRESAQPKKESTQIRMVMTDDGEDPDITPLMRLRKENAP
ncbi:H/ACA ribonucleoprotein complex subunit CBF5-like [Benincasa hispida]|uniref:H/ACA ribonucleoprotein complex subunit CBF5-like n=1 Tax=Benincasa hispida TaxID=102211 RepID=UPI0019012626|nr:H/ACA ribonucleoprotein complex subunit CBF5-like [Benincasa hispida]